jgi:hypothetical protein
MTRIFVPAVYIQHNVCVCILGVEHTEEHTHTPHYFADKSPAFDLLLGALLCCHQFLSNEHFRTTKGRTGR